MRNHVRMLRQAGIPLLAVMSFLSPLPNALAVPITVANQSFETLPAGGLPFGCGLGCSYSGASIPGWTNSGISGQFRPGTDVGNFTYFNTLSSDGTPTNAYTNSPDITQTVGATVQVGIMYTLQVDVGVRNDSSGVPGLVNLLIGGTPIPATGLTPTLGNWSTFTATYTGLPADIGKSIAIDLVFVNYQGNFDNVRLSDNTSSAVPEPSTYLLFATGLIGLLGYRWRRKRAA